MKKHKLQISIILLFTFALSACYPQTTATPSFTQEFDRPSRLTLAVAPYRVLAQLYDLWLPVVDYIAAETSLPVELTIADTNEEYVPIILDRQPDLAYAPGLQYLTIHRDAGYEAMVGVLPLSIGVLLVRADSPIATLSDLRGKTLGFTSLTALAANQTKAFLADKGLAAGEDYQAEIFENATLCANAVIAGQVDSGAVSLTYYQEMPDEQEAQFRVLDETPPLPPAAFAMRGDLAPEIRQMLVDTLLSLNETTKGQEIMQKLGWDEMIHVDDTVYDAVREFAEQHGIDY